MKEGLAHHSYLLLRKTLQVGINTRKLGPNVGGSLACLGVIFLGGCVCSLGCVHFLHRHSQGGKFCDLHS